MSYATTTAFAARLGPAIFLQLTAEAGATEPDLGVAQGHLDTASAQIDVRIDARYVTPVASPPQVIRRLAALECDVATYYAWAYRGVKDSDNPATPMRDAAMKVLQDIQDAELDLSGAPTREMSDSSGAASFGVFSETSRFNPPDSWGEDIFP